MWFPRQRDNQGMHTGLPWYNQSFFNPFNPNYQVATYPISPDGISTEIQEGYDPLKVYIFYDASTSKSYLIQPVDTKQVVISELLRTKTKKGYQVYFEGILKPVEHEEFQIRIQGRRFPALANLDAVKSWMIEQVLKPSETGNAHHAYCLVHDPKFKPLNWNWFPMELLANQ
tara:strand:+ start:1911 stop:2426 length:516 start_codon:yes stop_codon:yes gene_type:complete